MEKTVIATNNAPGAIGPYSQAKAGGGFLFTSGQIPCDPQSGERTPRTVFSACTAWRNARKRH